MPKPHLSAAAATAVRTALLAYYDSAQRPLPWRSTRDPYAIWISEVMAQQTRIETVIPYYERWLRRFPDTAALADAPVDEVLKEWEGLGYYSRARNLHSAARMIRERHGDAFPSTYAALRALPGVGDYTAGAVSSIAFGVAAPAVDGNVRRVLSRVFNVPAPSPVTLRQQAAELVCTERPGDFNQALMELGATICTPRAPRCTRCPIADHCAARAAGTQAELPRTTRRALLPRIDVATAVLRAPDERVLLVRRPPHGLLAGLWCFPGEEVQRNRGAADADVVDAVLTTARRFGTPAAAPVPLCIVDHTFSHRRERYICYVVAMSSTIEPEPPAVDAAWIGADRGAHTLPRAQQRIHRAAFELTQSGG